VFSFLPLTKYILEVRMSESEYSLQERRPSAAELAGNGATGVFVSGLTSGDN